MENFQESLILTVIYLTVYLLFNNLTLRENVSFNRYLHSILYDTFTFVGSSFFAIPNHLAIPTKYSIKISATLESSDAMTLSSKIVI